MVHLLKMHLLQATTTIQKIQPWLWKQSFQMFLVTFLKRPLLLQNTQVKIPTWFMLRMSKKLLSFTWMSLISQNWLVMLLSEAQVRRLTTLLMNKSQTCSNKVMNLSTMVMQKPLTTLTTVILTLIKSSKWFFVNVWFLSTQICQHQLQVKS